jgi:outer membrane protein OmpA-like peptidoglycan-associated protein
LDIFKTVIDPEGNHGQIINLGTVFNTEKDDFGFTMNVEGTDIFYTQDADIIRVILKNPDRLLKPLPTLVINGVIMDYEGHPVEAVVRISRKEDMQTVAKAKSNALTGEYSVAIQKADERYIKEITAANFREHREEIEILDPDNRSRMENRDLLIRANSELIFFDLDDSRIRDSEIDKMDSIITYLYNHKRSKVLLTGHADQLGTDRYNLELSSKRVEEVKTYFEKKGIPSRIMKTRFVGESQPLESHPRGEKSPINRRVEVLIVPAE